MSICRRLFALLFCLYVLPAIGMADGYQIESGDVLSLRVLEWQPIENRVQEWEAFSVELLVDADGLVTIPFLGQINAATLSPAELSANISDGLKQRLAISTSLDAVVAVARYRPVYIAGAVRTPGEYTFRPGLTAAQLVAQAGSGALQGSGAIDPREVMSREGTMHLLTLESERLTIRRAMLQAAVDGLETLVVPPRQGRAAWPASLVKIENEVLRLRRVRRSRELAALDNQILLLRNEIETLTERSVAQEALIESARSERENTKSLAERGLAVGSRVAETERNLVLLEAQLLDISTATLRARQAITLAEAEKSALRDRELIEDTRELQRVEEELERVLGSLATQQGISIMERGLVFGGEMAEDDRALSEPVVTIVRGESGDVVELSGPGVFLAPGDIVNVEMPRSWGRWLDEVRGPPIQ